MFNYFSIAGLCIGVINLSLAILISKFGKTRLHRVWSYVNYSISLWGFSMFVSGSTTNHNIAFIGWRIFNVGIILIAVIYYHVIYLFCNLRAMKFLIFSYIQGLFFIGLTIFTNLMFGDKLSFVFGQFYYFRATIFHHILMFIWIIIVGGSFYELYKYIRSSTGITKIQGKYLFIAMIFGYGGGLNTAPAAWGFNVYPYGQILVCVYGLLATYAIFKYRLMDIRIAVTRAGIFIFVYTFVLGLPLWFGIATQAWLWAILMMGILASVGPFAYSHLRQQIENVLFREQQRYQEAIKDLAKRMTHIREVDELFLEIVAEVYSVVQPQFISLYTFSASEKAYILSRHYLPKDYCFDKQISLDSQLSVMLSKNKRPILAESAGFSSLPLETLAIPFFSEGSLFGFLMLGQKSTKMMYTDLDFVTFDILSSQVSLALENAINLQQLKRSQMELLRQENLKFVQVLVKGLAHELLPPKLYKMSDAQNV